MIRFKTNNCKFTEFMPAQSSSPILLVNSGGGDDIQRGELFNLSSFRIKNIFIFKRIKRIVEIDLSTFQFGSKIKCLSIKMIFECRSRSKLSTWNVVQLIVCGCRTQVEPDTAEYLKMNVSNCLVAIVDPISWEFKQGNTQTKLIKRDY